MDAFAVSIVAGMTLAPATTRQTFRLAFHLGWFQFMMPVVGWLAGRELETYVSAYDHWIAFGLLTFVGGKMLWDARSSERTESNGDPTRGLMLVTLSVATSIDALAVGMSMAFMQVSIWVPCVVIGLVAAALSTVGITFGGTFGPKLGHWAQAVGAFVLIGIAVRIVILHT